MRILGKGSRPRGAGIRCYLKDLLESRHHLRIYMNKTRQFFRREFNAFSGLHGGLVLFEKIYLNPRSQIGLIWEKLF
jgi:hypothetical protein